MNAVQLERLSRVAVALEDASRYEFFNSIFSMGSWGYAAIAIANQSCGTPACAMGHFAIRTDLQKSFELYGSSLHYKGCDVAGPGDFKNYFGLSSSEVHQLFGADGCGDAQTPRQAAKFIRKFIAKKRKS